MDTSTLLTYSFIAVTILIFIVELIRLLQPIKRNSLNRLQNNYNKLLGKPEANKTNISAHDIFNINELYNSLNINLSHIKSAPNALVGLGILGTFVGLAISIPQINLQDNEEMLSSVNLLLGGMSTAFYTSIVGMFLSIILGFINRTYLSHLQDKLSYQANELDKIHLITNEEYAYKQLQALEKLGANIGSSIGSQIVSQLETTLTELVETVTDCVKDQLVEAGKSLENSASHFDETANTILTLTNNLNLVIKQIDNTLDKANQVILSISNTTHILNDWQTEAQQTTSELGDTAIQLQEAANKTAHTIDDLQNAILSTNSLIENTTQYANTFVSNQDKYNQMLIQYQEQTLNIQQLLQQLEMRNKELSNNIAEIPNLKPDIEHIFKAINEGLNQYTTALLNQTNSLIGEYTQKFTEACQSINATTAQLDKIVVQSANTMEKSVVKAADTLSNATTEFVNKITNKE